MNKYEYTPTTWIGGKTIGTADVMNNIEEGIMQAHEELEEVNSQLEHIGYYYACRNGIILNDINYASSNAKILNNLLKKGNCLIEKEGNIYIDDSIIVPNGRVLEGINKNTKIIQITKNKHIIRLINNFSSVKNLKLVLNEIPTITTACISVGGDNMACRGNYIENIVMFGKAKDTNSDTFEHIQTHGESKCIGVYYNCEYDGCGIYFNSLKDCYVIGCEYGISVGHKDNISGVGSWVTTVNVDNLIVEQGKYFGYFKGGGNTVKGSFQPWFSNEEFIVYSDTDLSTFNIVIYDVGEYNISHPIIFSEKSCDNNFYVWGPRNSEVFNVLDLGTGNLKLDGEIRSPKFLTTGYGGLNPNSLRNTDSRADFAHTFYGVQDNMLANAHLWGEVSSTISPSSGSLNDIFSNTTTRECVFKNITNENPLVLTIDLKDKKILQCSIIGLQFGEFMPKHIKIEMVRNEETSTLYENLNEKHGEIILSRLYKKNIDKIIVTINECWLNNEARLTYMWATSTISVGRSFLETSGGEIYGDLSLNNLTVNGDINANNVTTGIKLNHNTGYSPSFKTTGECSQSYFGSTKGEIYTAMLKTEYLGTALVGMEEGSQIRFCKNLVSIANAPLKLNSCDSDNRPIVDSYSYGVITYDTKLKKVILWNGSSWVNIDGTSL